MLDQMKVKLRRVITHGPLTLNTELRFRGLLERLPAGAYTCDPDGLITYFNQQAAELWGRKPKLNDPADRFCGSFKLYTTEGLPITHDECWMALALKNAIEYNGHEIVVERPDGERRTTLAYANPISDDAGKLVGAVNVLVDITDRKQAENVLREADRSKNEFLATLAHELRNPLAPIRAAVKILQLKQTLTPDSQSALDVIERQSAQMTRLIDDLLDIARITNNKLELRRERIDLRQAVDSAVETSRPLLEQRSHRLTLKKPARAMYVNADLVRLAQVISNLLNNAAKYTEPGGRIWLTVAREKGEAVIRVRDNGTGISSEMMPHVFEMFQQAGRARAGSPGGLGIGLTLVKRLVELHQGAISAHSAGRDHGSEFVVRLPILATKPVSAKTKKQQRAEPQTEATRILVADDNHDSADSLGLLLKILGNDVRIVHDGMEALDVASEFHPKVVLLDIGMPRLNGYETARKMRELKWGKRATLIAVTGWGEDIDRKHSVQAGFDHHFVKPIDPDALTQLISSIP
jgi:signal transduction histidine kinase